MLSNQAADRTNRFPILNRRAILKGIPQVMAAGALAPIAVAAMAKAKRILVRSAWQTVNIGDIAHTPGVLRILETYLPDAEVVLWPSSIGDGVEQILRTRFPKLQIAKSKEEISQAIQDCDFCLHGSGASFVAQGDLDRWHKETGKPFGVYGITLPRTHSTSTKAVPEARFQATVSLLSQARFVYFRDSRSLALAKESGCTSPIMEFGPDGAFATDLRDDTAAEAFLSKHDLQPKKFVCCIPRLRYTPYWMIPAKKRELEPDKHARNEALKEQDHAPLLNAIRLILSKTDLKVLLCPEDQTQMAVGKELLYDRLTEEEKKRVVHKEDYWLTGEALSTYVRSAGLFGNEMHSPIMCVGNGIPAIVCRWAEQTTKGYMWEDIGLGDWLFDFDVADDRTRMPEVVLRMVQNPDWAFAQAAKAKTFVESRQKATMDALNSILA